MILALKSTNILKWGEGEVEEEKSRGSIGNVKQE